MLLKTLNFKSYRIASNNWFIIRRFSSQIVKTNEDMNKIEERKDFDISLQNQNHEKDLSERQRHELTQVIKSPVQMDSFWEMNFEEKPFKSRSFFDFKGGISVDTLAMLSHKFDFSIPGIKRRFKYYIAVREEYNQRYIRRRHAILGSSLKITIN